jgi:ABC-type proline/glycine betaine transport system permease subunit
LPRTGHIWRKRAVVMNADRTTYKGSRLWRCDELLTYSKEWSEGLSAQTSALIGASLGLVSAQVSRLPAYLAVVSQLNGSSNSWPTLALLGVLIVAVGVLLEIVFPFEVRPSWHSEGVEMVGMDICLEVRLEFSALSRSPLVYRSTGFLSCEALDAPWEIDEILTRERSVLEEIYASMNDVEISIELGVRTAAYTLTYDQYGAQCIDGAKISKSFRYVITYLFLTC